MAVPKTVQSSLEILRASRALAPRDRDTETMEETVRRAVAVFERLGVTWALVGAHAIGMLTEPRATVDFDFVVEESSLKALVAALEAEFGDLEAFDMGPALRLGALSIDLIRSTTHPLFGEALRHTRDIEGWRVPRPEVLIVLKFLSAVNPWRGRTKKMYDVADLRAAFHAVGPQHLDRAFMAKLAAQVYPGAEREFAALLDKLERGEPVSV